MYLSVLGVPYIELANVHTAMRTISAISLASHTLTRWERGSGQTAIVELCLLFFHALTFRRRDKWVLCKQACLRMRARIVKLYSASVNLIHIQYYVAVCAFLQITESVRGYV